MQCMKYIEQAYEHALSEELSTHAEGSFFSLLTIIQITVGLKIKRICNNI